MLQLLQEDGSGSDIFMLIKGLSRSEKSYYRKMAKRHADHNSALHLKLFKLIETSNCQEDTNLCKELKIENKIHFSGLKAYLYKDILDTLVFQKRNNCVETQLYFMQDQIRSLQEKNLVNLAQKVCKKAISLASKYQKYHFLILLLHLQNRVLEFKDYKQYKCATDSIFSILQEAIELQKIYTETRFLYEKTRNLTYRTWLPITTEELIGIKKIEIILNEMRPADELHPLVFLYYQNVLALCKYMAHETMACGLSCQKIYECWKANPHLINEYSLLFLNSVNTTCYNDFLSRKIPQARKNIAAYARLADKHLTAENFCKHFEVIRFNTQLKIHLKSAEFSQAKTLLESNVDTIFSYSSKCLSSPEQLSVMCSVCISYFVLEQIEDAERLLSIIKEQNRNIKRDDILYFCLLFGLVILYEQEKWDQLDNDLKAVYHFLYAQKKLRAFERELVLFLGHLSDARSQIAAHRLISNFLKTKDHYREDPDRNLYLLYFNYYGWLESKVMKMKYTDYIKQHIKADL